MGSEKVYNPINILQYLDKGEFKKYWFETGTPTFLIELFKAHRYYVPQMESIEASEELLNKFDVEHLVVEAVLFQTGYLTISSHERLGARNVYTLTYANLEVKSALTNYILDTYSPNPAAKERHQGMLYKALLRGELSKKATLVVSNCLNLSL